MSDEEEVRPSNWIVVFFGVNYRPVMLFCERIETDGEWITLYRDGHPIKLLIHEVKAIRRIKEEHEQPEQGAGDGSGARGGAKGEQPTAIEGAEAATQRGAEGLST